MHKTNAYELCSFNNKLKVNIMACVSGYLSVLRFNKQTNIRPLCEHVLEMCVSNRSVVCVCPNEK